jgi:spectinomycin phosphotransferase
MNAVYAEPADLDRAAVSSARSRLTGASRADGGPFAEQARELVARRQTMIDDDWFAAYDALVPAARAVSDRWVITHGEPHAGDVLWLVGGGFRLIDWDTVALAPPERDLWMFDTAAEGVDPAAAGLYRLRWWMQEVCLYVVELHGAHVDDANTRASWRELRGCLDQQPTNRAAR